MSSTNRIEMLAERNASIDLKNPARARLVKLFDADSFVELDAFVKAGEKEAGVIAGYGLVEGSVVYAFSQDVSSDSGAVNAAHAKKIKKIYELAAKTGCPVVCVYDSKGAKLSEGNEMLAAYSEVLAASGKISGVVPQIALVLGTCAGVNAMLAAAADVLVMSREAELFMTAPFIAAANGDSAEDAGSAEAAAKAGVAAVVADDEDAAVAEVRKLLTMLPQNNLQSLPLFDFADSTETLDPSGCPKRIVEAIADAQSLVELSAEYGKGVYTFLGTMAGTTVGFVTTSKENALDSAACEKAARFVKVCDAFNIPIVTFIDSKGFALNADVAVVKDAAKLAGAYAEATAPILRWVPITPMRTLRSLGRRLSSARWRLKRRSSFCGRTALKVRRTSRQRAQLCLRSMRIRLLPRLRLRKAARLKRLSHLKKPERILSICLICLPASGSPLCRKSTRLFKLTGGKKQ